jgi:hypothetical protein
MSHFLPPNLAPVRPEGWAPTGGAGSVDFLLPNLVERSDSFACLTPTLSPRPFPPRRAGKGANSHIWPRLLN